MQKKEVVQNIIQSLQDVLTRAQKGRQTAHDDMIEAESAMQTRYGSAKEESEMLALSLGKYCETIRTMVTDLKNLQTDNGASVFKVTIGSIIYVYFDHSGAEEIFILLPSGGGTTVETDIGNVTAITPSSPLGKSLLGKQCGDSVSLPQHQNCAEIVTIY